MGLFASKEEKDSAQAESDRLKGLPVVDLATEVMEAFGPDGLQINSGHQQGAVQISKWLMRDHLTKVRYTQPVLGPVIEGLNVLESAGLVESRTFGTGDGKTFHATRLGETALAEGSVRGSLAAS